MVVHDRHLLWSGIDPPENNAPPPVDPNGVNT